MTARTVGPVQNRRNGSLNYISAQNTYAMYEVYTSGCRIDPRGNRNYHCYRRYGYRRMYWILYRPGCYNGRNVHHRTVRRYRSACPHML